MFKVSVTSKGRFDPDRIISDMKDRAFSNIESKLTFPRCPVHQKAPTATRTPDGKLQIHACCPTFKETVLARIKQ
jgi:hypothetical protein